MSRTFHTCFRMMLENTINLGADGRHATAIG
jgi:hypothetical protein